RYVLCVGPADSLDLRYVDVDERCERQGDRRNLRAIRPHGRSRRVPRAAIEPPGPVSHVVRPQRRCAGLLVRRTRSSHTLAANPIANFGFKRGTRIITLLVSLLIPKFA